MNHGRKTIYTNHRRRIRKKKKIYLQLIMTSSGRFVCADCTDTRPCWREMSRPCLAVMHRCSGCTEASGCVEVHPKCTRCDNTVHMCARCDPVDTCAQCTKRPHICLSKCIRGCIYKKAPVCNCGSTPRRLQVQKDNQNKGRYFWSCYECAFFEWDA